MRADGFLRCSREARQENRRGGAGTPAVEFERETAALSDAPFSEPCTGEACGRLRPPCQAISGTCSENELPFRWFQTQFRQRSCAWAGREARVALRRRKRVDREGLQGHGPSSQA